LAEESGALFLRRRPNVPRAGTPRRRAQGYEFDVLYRFHFDSFLWENDVHRSSA
jgi:hypothetical protein